MQDSRTTRVAFEKYVDEVIHNRRRRQVGIPSSDEQLLGRAGAGFDGVRLVVDRTRSRRAPRTCGGE